MQMEDFLPCILITVEDSPVPAILYTKLERYLFGRQDKLPSKHGIFRRNIRNAIYVFLRYYYYVDRRLRLDIVERQYILVFVDDFRWNIF